MKIILIVGVQNDFIDYEGNSAVVHKINEFLEWNALLGADKADYVVCCNEHHPHDHITFRTCEGAGKDVVIPLPWEPSVMGCYNIPETANLSPHCVIDTPGALNGRKNGTALALSHIHAAFRHGAYRDIDSRSALSTDRVVIVQDNEHKCPNNYGYEGLYYFLSGLYDAWQIKEAEIEIISAKTGYEEETDKKRFEVYLCGMPAEITVQATAIDIAREFEDADVYIIKDLCATVTDTDVDKSLEIAEEQGCIVTTSVSIFNEYNANYKVSRNGLTELIDDSEQIKSAYIRNKVADTLNYAGDDTGTVLESPWVDIKKESAIIDKLFLEKSLDEISVLLDNEEELEIYTPYQREYLTEKFRIWNKYLKDGSMLIEGRIPTETYNAIQDIDPNRLEPV